MAIGAGASPSVCPLPHLLIASSDGYHWPNHSPHNSELSVVVCHNPAQGAVPDAYSPTLERPDEGGPAPLTYAAARLLWKAC